MQVTAFLIKYGEIGIKGKNRYMFEDALIRQIRYALSSVDGEFDVTKESGRIYVKALGEYDYDDTIEALKRVFGIADICPMVQIDDKDYEPIVNIWEDNKTIWTFEKLRECFLLEYNEYKVKNLITDMDMCCNIEEKASCDMTD